MSGKKVRHVSVAEQELRRLREQASKLRSIQQDLPERLEAIREQSRRELQSRLSPLEQRAQRHEAESKQLKSSLANLEQETHQRLHKQRIEFRTALNESESRQQQTMQAETQRLESAMRQGFSQQHAMILEISAEQREEYLSLNQQLDQKFTQLANEERSARERLENQLQQEKQDLSILANSWAEDVEQVWQQIERDYQHERFSPGQLSHLRTKLNMAQSNVEVAPQAAIANLQTTYFSLADLRLNLEQKEQEWLLYYNAASEDLKSLLEEVRANRECEIEIGEGEEAERLHLEVNYWTSNRLQDYEDKLKQLEEQLQEGKDSLSSEQIQQIAQEVEDQRPHLEEIVEQAREEILSSQMRVDIADKVAEVLGGLGYDLLRPELGAGEEEGYEAGDQRRSYVIKLRNLAGGEVVTIISPQRKDGSTVAEFGKNTVSINSFGEVLHDEKAQRQHAKAVTDALAEEGLEIGEQECFSEPQYQYQDVEKILNVKAENIDQTS